jgi:hypothetical protein
MVYGVPYNTRRITMLTPSERAAAPAPFFTGKMK